MSSMEKTILIVDDDRTERRMITNVLRAAVDLNFAEAENGREAIRILKNDIENSIALIILDLDMPVMGGLETMEIISQNYPALPVIVLTGSTDRNDAIQATRLGATDFLSKPIEQARLDVSARNALKMAVMREELSRLKRYEDDTLKFSDLIGHDQGLKENVKIGNKAATCDLPVLITGETGTGKEMFARAIHGQSNRSRQSFIAVNCGAIPEKLVESTLFGHEKGSFTGAINKALGKFQEANGGTIFLDEIGELPLEAQVKLLRVLQQSEVEPVGAGKPVPLNIRVISATNRNLAQEVKEGRFREDLYFRLNVLHIDMPPLRERKDDIAIMAPHFIELFCTTNQTPPKRISKEAMEKLQNYAWPGNVRELENIINRTMAMSDNEILSPQDFSFIQVVSNETSVMQENAIIPVRADGSFKSYRELEQEIIALALKHHNNNITQTAKILGIAKSTLYTKIETLADLKSA